MYPYFLCAALAVCLSACGGGGTGSSSDNTSSPAATAAAAALTAQATADNKIRLTLSGTGSTASRYCIRQDAVEPLASDACFADSDSTLLVQEKTITPSNTQRVTFTTWRLSGNTVSRHASVSTPGKTCSAAAYAALTAANTTLPAVCIITSSGESVLLLDSVKAPITAANFLRYVNQGFYDQTVFHRFWKDSLNFVQGGGFTYDVNRVGANRYVEKASTLTAIVLESTAASGLSNTAGTIAMARTNDPDSATAGFFVNTSDNDGFNSKTARDGYAVFGRFIYGAQSWTDLLNSVSGSGLITNPSTPVDLQWAYQIQ